MNKNEVLELLFGILSLASRLLINYYFIMGNKYISIFFILFTLISISAEAQLFKPFDSFRVIKTEHFDIIYPSESETSARLLASYADRIYKEMSELFDIEVPGRIPVTFAPHTDMFNGFYNPFPYPHIVLYDTPMNLEWTNFSNNLEALFIHELAHAVSLNTRGRFFRVLRSIFGNWVTPSAINAPAFMVEGVTIAMESVTGFGRANDPLIKQKLRQAIHEGQFLNPFQASGVSDLPNQHGVFYDYGGLFSSWLIQTYGMEKYAELWQTMGKMFFVSFAVYRSGFYRIFKNVYGVDFLDAWNALRDSLELNELEENADELLPARNRFLSKRRNSISAIASGKKDVYILDSSADKIIVYDTQAETVRRFNTDSFFSYDIDVSAEGDVMLVSGYQLAGDRYRAVVTEHKTDSGRKTGRYIRGLYKARYFREGVIGLRSQLHNNCIVYENFNGNAEILFIGGEELVFSGPQALDNERIVFVVARNGERELMLYNYVTGELFRVENAARGSSGVEFWRYTRGLGVSEGKLFFSHNIDDRMYKLASVNLETMQAVFSGRDFSGGVFFPVSANNAVYYSGAFFSGDGFLRFPETPDSISGTVININIVKQNPADYGLNHANADSDSQTSTFESARYFGIKYLNPFKLWLPLPLLRLNSGYNDLNVSIDGVGLFSVMMDPTDRNLFIVLAFADIRYRMALIEHFSWRTTVPGFPMTLEFSDKVSSEFGNNPFRETRVVLSGSFLHFPGRWGYGFSLGAGYFRVADDDGGVSAYHWEENASAVIMNSNITFTNLQRSYNELFGNGFSLNIKGSVTLWASYFQQTKLGRSLKNHEKLNPRVEGIFRAGAETRFPLSFTLYGAYDKTGMNLHGVSRAYGAPVFENNASKEYPLAESLILTWIAGGEISVGLFSVEIQNNLSHVFFNRFFGTLTLRNVVFDSGSFAGAEGVAINGIRLAQSLVLNLKMTASFLPVKSLPVFIEPNIWGAWKFSNTITGQRTPVWAHLAWGVGFNYRY